MNRIIIIGCGGSGKSTLARNLSKKTNLPVVHLDKIFWKEGWVNISREEFNTLLKEELKKEKWIIDGNYDRTIKERIEMCDTVIYLDYPRMSCLFGVIKRVVSSYGKVRPDMADGCPERFDLEFLKGFTSALLNINEILRERNKYLKKYVISDKEIVDSFLTETNYNY